ncbi:hypothetical protein ERICIV_00877 [Paenibacillus larvae subsp. larvae]|uniref:YxeA family protein n=1 Tax=Paenibacillus larvae subsp. larvae TaxID=147375 RepID=A0A2L1UAA0_9BACL|nr:YxeA family protein [Paenibacillus larvae]AQT85679.1 hypothetical protein B1222_16730 [Paenibacillus larvae subsp. pulvifaciens]AVF25081.1 hypothetical protein ERICIII_00874 [Paenibacillus larvae subsp. larvae]AVF29845.1 hypothetical protein ERICIV_00877 [Paenibacillus larvae subsp. larvae]MBH0341216.1 hypothetical protein [Paenibacillus larvae]MCY7522379.1 YxeA family protein [Paenibacillus larvae]
MRKYTLYFGILFIFALLLTGCDFNKSFKDQAYTQIKGEGKLVDGRYQYTLPSYNDEGKQITVTFGKPTGEKFKEDAYLRLYLKSKDGEKVVTSYEEVQKNDLPTKVKEKLQVP